MAKRIHNWKGFLNESAQNVKPEAVMAAMDKIAEEEKGEFGYDTLDAEDRADVLSIAFEKFGYSETPAEIVKKLDKIAAEEKGEFGFDTLDADDKLDAIAIYMDQNR